MKTNRPILVVLVLVVCSIFSSLAFAKRAGPKEVAPVVHHGVKYVAIQTSGREGRVEARNPDSGVKLWDAVVYTVKIDPKLEEDVQWVFITGMSIHDGTLQVTNEKNETYALDLTTRKVNRVEKTPKGK